MKFWKQRSSSKCPRCEAPVEDAAHVWRCPQREAKAVWEQPIDGLREWMLKQKMHPAIRRIICERLLPWHSGNPSQAQPEAIPFLRSVVSTQDALGWQPLLQGGLAFEWQFAQQSYFKSLRSKKSGRRWVSALVRKLWTVAWDQWEHRNSILHERDSTKHHTLITQDTDRIISRQLAMGVQCLHPKIIISSRLWRSFSKHHCMPANSGLCRLSRHGNGRNAVLLSKQRSIPKNANS
jgi:hypothetical protein